MSSPYEVLGVQNTADDAEIKAAFRKLAKKWHPDVNQGNPSAEIKFKEINEAYETLKDPQKRAAYDYMSKPRSGAAAGGFYTQSDWDRRSQYGRATNDAFEEMLREAARRNNGYQSYQSHTLKNKDTILNYSISFEESFTGKEVELRYNVGGKSKTTKVTIPKSVNNGAKIRFAGQGDDTLKDVPAGDLFVIINIKDDPRFVRNDSTVSTTIYIDFIDAMLGTTKRVPCIDGSEINLRVYGGMNPGSSIKVPEKGFYDAYGKRGPMMVEVVMEQPKLNPEQLAALAKIRDL